jgi:hypothetical protein
MLAVVCALLGAALLAGRAGAERVQDGNLIVTLSGGIRPRALPRHDRAPVAVHLGGRVLTSDGAPLPRVNWIKLELAWRGRLFRRGLTVCPRSRLDSRSSSQALKACGSALVGHGGLFAQIFVPNQRSFGVQAHLLVFNGQGRDGRPKVLVHAYAGDPPVSFVIPFSVHHQKGSFRTVLVTTIRRSVGPWPHVANFHVVVARSFRYRGERHSYLSASCPIPKAFTAGFLSFARATYTFEGGKHLTTESVRSCRAR